MVAIRHEHFEIGITSGSQELCRKMRMGHNLSRLFLENCRILLQLEFREQVSVNYSFNVNVIERPENDRQTVAYSPRAREHLRSPDKVEPAISHWPAPQHAPGAILALIRAMLQPGLQPDEANDPGRPKVALEP